MLTFVGSALSSVNGGGSALSSVDVRWVRTIECYGCCVCTIECLRLLGLYYRVLMVVGYVLSRVNGCWVCTIEC